MLLAAEISTGLGPGVRDRRAGAFNPASRQRLPVLFLITRRSYLFHSGCAPRLVSIGSTHRLRVTGCVFAAKRWEVLSTGTPLLALAPSRYGAVLSLF